jgi:TonB-linked SusC/RagA family outer membrane protein
MVTTVQDYYAWNSNPATAYILSSMANETLKWETTEQIDLGLDLGFFDDRIGLTVDYYIKNTKDLLLKADIAASSGFSTATLNVGELKNTGWEITLETVNIKNKNFNWTSSLNFAFNKNTIVALNSGQDRMFNAINWHNTFKTMNAYVSEVGSPAGQMYGYIYEGTYKLDEFDYDAATGKYTLKEGIPALGTSTQPGDPKYRDLVNVDTDGDGVADATDGKITDADRTTIGNGHPVFVGGFTNNFTFYGFDLNIFFQWSYGSDILNANRIMFDNGYNQKWTNMYRSYKDRWTMDNPTSDTPRIGATNTLQYSTRYVEDGSYLKLRNVTLGYTFPKKALKKMNISNLRLYVSAENLGTITKYSGMDPEVSTRHSVLTPGFDWSAYPRAFSASFGVNLTF